MQMYPGWSARDNYAQNKKKKRKRMQQQQQDPKPSPGNDITGNHKDGHVDEIVKIFDFQLLWEPKSQDQDTGWNSKTFGANRASN